jgi:hypothetical protein
MIVLSVLTTKSLKHYNKQSVQILHPKLNCKTDLYFVSSWASLGARKDHLFYWLYFTEHFNLPATASIVIWIDKTHIKKERIRSVIQHSLLTKTEILTELKKKYINQYLPK